MVARVKDPQGHPERGNQDSHHRRAARQTPAPGRQPRLVLHLRSPTGIASLGDSKIIPYADTFTGIHDHTGGIVNLAILEGYYQNQLWRVKVKYAPGKHECWGWPDGVIPNRSS